MKLSDLGERALLNRIRMVVDEGRFSLVDDCAYLSFGEKYLLVTVDMVRGKTHFPEVMTPWDMGWFVAAVNLSDIAAMGGEPVGLLLSLGLPGSMDENHVLEMMRGALECVRRYGAAIIGGDTKEHDEVTVGGVAVGLVSKEKILLRTGMKPGDVVAVTGCLGKAGAGFLALKHGLKKVSFDGLIKPVPRVVEGRGFAENRLVSSCMDISDGFAASLYQLAEINDVGFLIEKSKLPVAKEAFVVAEELGLDPYLVAMDYGGDYELLVTLPEENVGKACDVVGETGLTVVGRVTESGLKISFEGAVRDIVNRGFEHFKSNR
ncbi:MAG TPA: thiamine-phosphate kinase [Thermoplasmatales archaeon]|nr:thiamine-phosphate kinase [Thermoplasmatales archaeon]